MDENRHVVMRLFAEDLSEPDAARRHAVARAIIHPEFHDPTNPPGMQHGLDGHLAVVDLFMGAFPDMQWTVDELLADGDRVVALTTMTGTHRGEFFGIPATGRAVRFAGIHVMTLRDGRIVLHRGVNDDLAFMRQLGVVPELVPAQGVA